MVNRYITTNWSTTHSRDERNSGNKAVENSRGFWWRTGKSDWNNEKGIHQCLHHRTCFFVAPPYMQYETNVYFAYRAEKEVHSFYWLHTEILKNYDWGKFSKQLSKHNHSVYTDKLHWLIIWTVKNRNNFYWDRN